MTDSNFSLLLPAEEGNLILVREVGGGFAELLGAPAPLIDDIKTALTEACSNSILHGYPSRPGSVLISGIGDPKALEFAVTDFGEGLSAVSSNKGLGFGLPLIAALADEFEVKGGLDGGARVRMSFPLDSLPAELRPDSEPDRCGIAESILLETPAADLAKRLAIAVGAASDLDVDRLSDLEMAMDLASRLLIDEEVVSLQISELDDSTTMTIGPFSDSLNERDLEPLDRLGIGVDRQDESDSITLSISPSSV